MRQILRAGWMGVMGITTMLLFGCGGGPRSILKKGELPQTIDQNPTRGAYIESIGIGAADSSLTNQTQRKATSRNAAIVAAQYEMLSMIKGLTLEGGILVSRAIEQDSTLMTRIEAEIKGAEIVKTEWTNDDGCVVTLRLPKRRLEKVLGQKFQ